jgi:hypothetical protein
MSALARRIALSLALLSMSAHRVVAQETTSCGGSAGVQPDSAPANLAFFGGWYGLASATAADSSDVAQIGDLQSVNIPSNIGLFSGIFGGTKGSDYDPHDHNNYTNDGANVFSVQFGNHPNAGFLSQIPGSLLSAQTMNWCVNPDDGHGLHLRAAVLQDLRWRGTGNIVVNGLGCAFGSFFGGESTEWCMRQHFGPFLYSRLTGQTTGFPVSAVAIAPDAGSAAAMGADAEAWTKALYGGNDDYSMAVFNTDFDITAGGRIVIVHFAEICPEPSLLQRLFGEKPECIPPKDQPGIQVTLSGEVRRRTWLDPRVGVPDSAASVETRMSVQFAGRLMVSRDDKENQKIQDRFDQACSAGCGGAAIGLAEGQVHMPGASDSLHYAMLCRMRSPDGHDCMTSGNTWDVVATASPPQIDSALTQHSTEDLRLTDWGRMNTGSGQRQMGTVTLNVPSEVERACLRRAQEDSIEDANGPVVEGTTAAVQPTITARVATCRAEWTAAPGGGLPPAKPPAGSYGPPNPAAPVDTTTQPTCSAADRSAGNCGTPQLSGRLPSRTTAPTVPPVCREYYGMTMCKIGTQWVKKSP